MLTCGDRIPSIFVSGEEMYSAEKGAQIMAIRSICFLSSPPFKPAHHRIPISRSKASLPPIKRCSFAREQKNQRTQLVIKAKVSAEREILAGEADSAASVEDIGILSIHHVGILCENLEKSLDFYQNLLGLQINAERPHDKLPYRGAWLWVGDEMIHLMELPNPDPLTGRPEHGGRDRHACIAIRNVTRLKENFDKAGIKYTLSRSGRPAIFTRDPDGNALEFTQID